MEKYYKQFENCRQHDIPDCQKACPFQLGILDFQAKMAKNRYNAAYKTFRNSVGFPDIVASLCPQYCEGACARKTIDQSVQMNLLEKTCMAKATQKEPTAYNVPAKDKKIAIVGAGISGLACALRLCTKKYEVSIYEKSGRIGGQLWDLLPPEVFLEDIQRQFKLEKYELHLNTEIKKIQELTGQGFDAIYIATGSKGEDFGALNGKDGHCFLSGNTAVFAGGSLVGKDVLCALSDGLVMAWAIEVYFQTGRLEYPIAKEQDQLKMGVNRFQKTEPVRPSDNGVFTDEEAVQEAERCMRCQCDACRSYCHLSEYLKKWPLQMRDEIMTTTMSSGSMIHKTPAVRLINMCTRCGLCESGCPGGIQLGEMIRKARYKLHNIEKMPGAYHQFWLMDMEFANSSYASVALKAPDSEHCNYAFFPGCHLGAANPEYVLEPYRWLLSKNQDTGLILRCCGVPADWAGNEEMHSREIEDFDRQWQSLGKPTLIVACPSCMRHIKSHLPQIQLVSLYEMLEEQGIDSGNFAPVKSGEVYSVFDPCSANGAISMQEAVRNLAQKSGIKLEEIPEHQKGACCGFGGHTMIANPEYAKFVAQKCSVFSENPYISYCINCRDIFREEGKPVWHILDILFNIDMERQMPPDIMQRRQNRVHLKETLLREFWGKEMEEKPVEYGKKLIISPQIREKMNKLRILEEDVYNVIAFCKNMNRRVYNAESNTYTSYNEIGSITCWVEYAEKGEIYEVVNVFTHRMKIELEVVWNGRKREADM